jgi:hypothetical protein
MWVGGVCGWVVYMYILWYKRSNDQGHCQSSWFSIFLFCSDDEHLSFFGASSSASYEIIDVPVLLDYWLICYSKVQIFISCLPNKILPHPKFQKQQY